MEDSKVETDHARGPKMERNAESGLHKEVGGEGTQECLSSLLQTIDTPDHPTPTLPRGVFLFAQKGTFEGKIFNFH